MKTFGLTRPVLRRWPIRLPVGWASHVDGWNPWCLGLRTKRRPAGNWPDGLGASRAPCWKDPPGGASFDTPQNLMTTGPASEKRRPGPTPCTRLWRPNPSPARIARRSSAASGPSLSKPIRAGQPAPLRLRRCCSSCHDPGTPEPKDLSGSKEAARLLALSPCFAFFGRRAGLFGTNL